MSVLPPSQHQNLFGHSAIVSRLKKSFDAQQLHHAIILNGLEGIGKETLAFQLIRYALAFPTGKPGQDDLEIPESHIVTKQIAAGSHPHVFIIQPVYDDKKQRFKRDITLDALNGLTNFLRLAPQQDAPRFILINPADGMNNNTQNALLKLLEEPPAKTHFLLLTTQIGALLPTIRSRCLTLSLDPLSLQDFTAAITRLMPAIEDDKIAGYFYLSGGAVGQAIQNLEMELLENYGGLCRAILAWNDEGDSKPAMEWAEELSRDDVLADRLVETLLAQLALFLKAKITGETITATIPEEERVLERWAGLPDGKILSLYDRIGALWQMGEGAYLDRKLVLLQIAGLLSMDKENRAVLA
ncbi:MAG: polymerase subunit delta [Alphaproteobacteria bacterium]|nr:polymerase subunit delta [Alphaproteobacteria bacterium]